jgi:hypothetical protein
MLRKTTSAIRLGWIVQEEEQAVQTKSKFSEPVGQSFYRFSILFAVLIATLSFAGCGGGNGSTAQQVNPTPPPTPIAEPSVQGTWQIVLHSDIAPDNYLVLEANLSQSGAHVFSGSSNTLIFQPAPNHPDIEVALVRLGGQCDSGPVGKVTVDATLSNPEPTSATVALTLTSVGDLGTAVTTVSGTTNGTNITDGTYLTPAACGFPEDHGTFEGYQDSAQFSGETYMGNLNGGSDAIVSQFQSTAGGYGLTVKGTDNGSPFTLSGTTTGFSLELSGTIGGQPYLQSL